MSTVLTIAEPMVKLRRASLADVLARTGLHARERRLTVTRVPGFQKSAGRHISWRLSSQPHEPGLLAARSSP